MKTKIGFILVVSLFITGCANISTLSRTTVLPPRGDGPVTGTGPQSNQVDYNTTKASGLAIHLDAPQRLVFSKDGIVCAEPSPDALQAYAASQGLSFLTPSDVSVQLANAFSGNSASIGLRTQSITLMREILYRICEASYGKKITDFDVAQLMRRSQDLTLGVLAIEQLSGTVKAQQVGISTKANADASGNLRATRANLAAVRDDELMAETDLNNAKKKKEDQDKLVVNMETAYKGIADTDPSKPDAGTKLQAEKDKAVAYEKDLQAKKKNYEEAQDVTKKIEENLGKALLTAKATAEGEVQFSGGEGGTKIDDKTAQHISWAAIQIVDKIVNKDHTVDSCISLLNKFVQSDLEPSIQQSEQNKKKLDQLQEDDEKVISKKNELEEIKVGLETALNSNKSGKSPEEIARAVGPIEKLSIQIGQLHEKHQLNLQARQELLAQSSIRGQCMSIIQDHLERQKKEQQKELSKK